MLILLRWLAPRLQLDLHTKRLRWIRAGGARQRSMRVALGIGLGCPVLGPELVVPVFER